MKISVIGGTGYVGLVTGVGLAALGHKVICADIDEKRVNDLNNNVLPIYEKGLNELLKKARDERNIKFTSCLKSSVEDSDIIIIAVGTPESLNGETDMSQFMKVLKSIANNIDGYKVIVIKSTVPVGTNEASKRFLRKNIKNTGIKFDIVSNPEFLREGSAVNDFLNPERIIIGADSAKPIPAMKRMYGSFSCPLVLTDSKSAEMIKYACNAYLALRISYINEIAEISQKVGADIDKVINGMKLDKRIGGHYLSPGPGFGGPCLSKDIKSLINTGINVNADVGLLKAVLNRNRVQISNILDHIRNDLCDIPGKRISVLGLSFKAGTNDIRNSPSVSVIEELSKTKNEIVVYDPLIKQIEGHLNSKVTFAATMEEAMYNSDCLIIMTEWDEFKQINFSYAYSIMRTPYIIDTRNLLSGREANNMGFKYLGTGKIYNPGIDNALREII